MSLLAEATTGFNSLKSGARAFDDLALSDACFLVVVFSSDGMFTTSELVAWMVATTGLA